MENITEQHNLPQTIGKLILSHRKAWESMGSCLLALYSLVFMFTMTTDFAAQHRPSSLYVALFEGAVVWFSLFRPMPKKTNISVYDWSIAILGSFAILLTRPAPQVHDHVLLQGMQLFGMGVSLAGLFSLNKSFGLVAANRGIKTGGMYAIVRHPIYAGYFISFGAFLLQNMTLANAVIYTIFVTSELLRVVSEERVLLQDPTYAAYARQTRWRVVPLIF